MRKLDGYYEGPGGNVMAIPMDGAFDAYCAERLGTADSLLLGRNVRRADAHATVAELKDRSGSDILVFASRVMWNDLLAADLVDEVHLVVGGVVLGGGTPAFSEGTTAKLELLDTRTFDGSHHQVRARAIGATTPHPAHRNSGRRTAGGGEHRRTENGTTAALDAFIDAGLVELFGPA